MGEFCRLEVTDGVGTIRLDRPKMNALNRQVQEEIRAAATEAAGREDVRAVVVWGGERVFAAGADIKEMNDMSYTDMVQRSGGLQSSFTAVAKIPKPVVAAVNGYALGGGCELALCADVRFAAEDAVLGQPEILLGIIPGAGGTQRLTRLVGPSKAKDLVFTGRFVKAEEALAIGLVDRVLAPDQVYDEAVAWAKPVQHRRRRSPCARPRRASTAATRSTWRPAWRSSASSSRPCSRPRTARSAWNPSSSTDRAKPGSWGVEQAQGGRRAVNATNGTDPRRPGGVARCSSSPRCSWRWARSASRWTSTRTTPSWRSCSTARTPSTSACSPWTTG